MSRNAWNHAKVESLNMAGLRWLPWLGVFALVWTGCTPPQDPLRPDRPRAAHSF